MPSIEPEELPLRRNRGELLEHIYAEGARRRKRRRIGGVGLSVVALAVLAGSIFAIDLPGSTPQHVATRGQTAPPSPGSTTIVELPTTLPADAVQTPAPTLPPTGVPTTERSRVTGGAGGSAVTTTPTSQAPETTVAPTTTQPATTLPVGNCRNSGDPACGPFHWDPDPGPNLPLVIEVTATARAGDPRTFDFAIVYSDGDAPIADGCRTVSFGDGSPNTFTGSTPACAVATCLAAFGTWSPPTPVAGRAEATVTHTFGAAGTYEVQLSALSRHSFCHDPYTSYGSKLITVVVA